MKPNEHDPLSALFSDDAKVVDRQHLATLVGPYIKIDKNTKDFGFLPSFSKLSGNALKIEILLAAAKARSMFLNEPDGLLPKEIIGMGIMATGSVKVTLKNLFDGHKIKKDKDGRYFLPSYRLPDILKDSTNN